MQNNSQKLISISLYLILAVTVVILGLFYYSATGVTLGKDSPLALRIAEYGSSIDLFIIWAYVLIGVAALFAIVPSIIQMITQPKNTVKSIISLVVIAVIVLIAYVLSDGTPFTTGQGGQLPGYTGNDNVPDMLKFADTMLFTMYFLLAGAVLSIIYAEVVKIFK